jgi:hypothetical protein
VELSVGVVVAGWLDLAPLLLGGGGCRLRVQIWELGMLGRGPGWCGIADDFILSFVTGVYFNSISSQRVTGLLRLMVVLGGFFGGGGRRRGGRLWTVREDSRGNIVIFCFFRGLREIWQGQPVSTTYVSVFVRSIVCSLTSNTNTYSKKKGVCWNTS